MVAKKRKWSKPTINKVSVPGDMPLDDMARLSDEQLQEYLDANGFWDAATVYQASSDFILRNIAGEVVLVPIGKKAHNLNSVMMFTESGAFLWECLSKESLTKTEMANALSKEYTVDYDSAMTDVLSFLEKSIAHSMVEIV